MTEQGYNQMARHIREKSWKVALIRCLNKMIVAVVFISYVLLLICLGVTGEYEDLYHSVIVPAVAFVALSIFRKCVSAKRPYEVMDIDPIIPKDKSGSSFPSRHVFSVFMIGMTFLQFSVENGMILMILGVILAVIRIVGGVHFTRDVVCGAAIGILSGLLGFYVIF